MFYIGAALVIGGFILLRYFGVSAEETQRRDEMNLPQAHSDDVGSWMLLVGIVLVVLAGVIWGVSHFWRVLNYGLTSSYVQANFSSSMSKASLFSGLAIASFSLIMTALTCGQFRYNALRRGNFIQANKIRGRYNKYSVVFYRFGLVYIWASVLIFVI